MTVAELRVVICGRYLSNKPLRGTPPQQRCFRPSTTTIFTAHLSGHEHRYTHASAYTHSDKPHPCIHAHAKMAHTCESICVSFVHMHVRRAPHTARERSRKKAHWDSNANSAQWRRKRCTRTTFPRAQTQTCMCIRVRRRMLMSSFISRTKRAIRRRKDLRSCSTGRTSKDFPSHRTQSDVNKPHLHEPADNRYTHSARATRPRIRVHIHVGPSVYTTSSITT